MKTYIPLDRLKRSRDSGSALYNMHPTDVLGRAVGGVKGLIGPVMGPKGLKTKHLFNPLNPIYTYLKINYKNR